MKTILFNIISLLLICNLSAQEKNPPDLYVFVGEKIEVREFQPEVEEGTILLDYAFKAKYKILENIYGDLKMDTIEFIAYDHYGTPSFSNYRYVLLYVVNIDGEYYHSKYQYSALYKTKDNRWAGTYSVYDYEHSYNQNTKIKPEKIEFESEVVIDLKSYSGEAIKKWFPEPYFKIRNDKAIAIYGNYIEELFQLKKDGVLKARGYFK